MKAGRELDALIAEKVMNYRVMNYRVMEDRTIGVNCVYSDSGTSFKIFRPSILIADAWLAVEKLDKDRKFLYVSNVASGWKCNIEADRWYAVAETAPLAICLAALKAVGYEMED